MPEKTPIISPAKYVSATAVGFASQRGELALVTSNAPLPVTVTNGSGPRVQPLSGRASSSTVVGPFAPNTNVPFHLQLSGEWRGRVSLERSTDKGATRQGLTIGGTPWASFSVNVNEPVWQESDSTASFWLNIMLEGGEVMYRLSQ
jgi:hypothetical protein